MNNLFFKRLLLPVIFLILSTGCCYSKSVTILNKSLIVNELSQGISITSIEGYENWTFENCITTAFDENMYIQAGNGTNPGSITTPTLAPLNGNSRLTLDAISLQGNDTLVIQNEKGTIIAKHFMETANVKTKLSPTLFRNGNNLSRLKFTCIGQDNIQHPFIIANVSLLYMDNNPDFIFYESFNNVKGNGGNDDKYAYNEFYEIDIPYVNENRLEKYPLLDYPENKVQYIYAADKCIFLGTKTSSIYNLTNLPINKTVDCKLSFWIAGETNIPTQQSLSISIEDKTVTTLTDKDIPDGNWKGLSVYISNMSLTSTITFQGGNVFLDDVMITEVTDTLDESKANNEELLSSYSGKTMNLALKRTLQKDIWNTLCLPFEFTNSSIEGADIEIERLKSVSDGVFHFEPDAIVPAGEPFILKTSQTIANPKFNAVTISATTPGTAGDAESGYYLKGIFSPEALSTDGSNIFLATDGNLYKPAPSTNIMNGLRAYMVVPSTSRASRLMHDPYGTTGIQQQPATTKRPTTFYNLWGQAMGSSLQQLPKGIYIANGRKMLKK